MTKKVKSSSDREPLLPGKIVLPEVKDKLIETGRPVEVICAVHRNSSVDKVIDFLLKLGAKIKKDKKGKELHTDYYVFATLKDLKQINKIDETHGDDKKRCIAHVWLDKKMEQCYKKSQKTINAEPARNLFKSEGEDIHWAVLDTGIDVKHKWFNDNASCCVVSQSDFTGEGLGSVGLHGTHVAGIIKKIAPKITLHDYKVLGENGGSASMIISAMYDIRKKNFEAGKVVIHGVNMSLGGPVPVGSYGCGWSPECQEANRLAASGVVVCAAAGNDGHKVFATVPGGQLRYYRSFVDLGIIDPGNAEDIITVGSSHKVYPHSFGPSYFSSKGPTGDGRCKPDCLAPGEKILSAKAGGKKHNETIEMSGTSMATPHVSGAVAVFMSAKPEFKGRAKEVKQILMNSCTDLKRDRYFQGAGLVDLLRMIQSV
jgi:subtilisin family serine protease